MAGRVIAVSGWRGSGKDTTAQYLVEKYGYTQLSFAHALKDMVSRTYKIDREDLDNPAAKEAPLSQYPVITTDPFTALIHEQLRSELRSGYWTPRALCILEGSIKRSVYPNYWVRSIAHTIRMAENSTNFVISDLRYKSEIDTLSILLPCVVSMRIRRFEEIDTLDPSERDLDHYPFDYTVPNMHQKEILYACLDRIHQHLSATDWMPNSRRMECLGTSPTDATVSDYVPE